MHPRPPVPARPVRHAARAVSAALLLSLAACGGGGGDGDGRDDVPASAGPAGGGSFGPIADGPDAAEVEAPTTLGAPEDPADDEPVAAGADASRDEPAELARADVREIDEVYAYRASGPWADVLAGCGLAEELEDACTLTELPFIAQATPTPSVDDVMDRVLVTHDWMGERFEAMLRAASEVGLLRLFAPITSITIGSTVRPSFYSAATGGIRLDPDYLWLTVEEKATVSIDEDSRAPYRALLDFRDVFVTLVGNESAYEYFALDDASERTFEQAERPLFSLLFHELAHANDFLPPGDAGLLDASLRPWDALVGIEQRWLSPQLQAQYPQYSSLLAGLADVRFRGEEPTAAQAAVQGDVVGAEFANDGGIDFYAYSSIREDLAELFQSAMMKAIYDVDVHVAFTNRPADPGTNYCDELFVGWGAGRRLGDPSVATRAGWTVERMYGPSEAIDAFVAEQSGTQTLMVPGTDLCTSLYGTGLAARSRDLPRTLPRRPMPDAERHALARRLHPGLDR